MIIYKTTNIINNKIYVGKDTNNNPDYIGSGKILKYAIKKYGKENFKKEILEECENINELIKKEIYWIKKLNSVKVGYNLTELNGGGYNEFAVKANKKKKGKTWNEIYSENGLKIMKNIDRSGEKNPFYGKHHSDENKIKFAENTIKFHTGRKRSNETKKNISNGILNSNHSEIMKSDKVRKKISECTKKAMENKEIRDKCAYWKGKKQPKDMVEKRSKKVSLALKGVPKSEQHKEKLKEAWKKRKAIII